jgi:hypothetical protein
MNRAGYIKIMQAAVNLIAVIMTEAGKVPAESARKVAQNILKAVTGDTGEK